MRFAVFMTMVLSSQALVLEAPIGHTSFKSGLESLKQTRAALGQELGSLISNMLTNSQIMVPTNSSEDLVILPKNLLSSEVISNLGLKIEGKFHDLKLGKSHQKVLIPTDSTNMFLFNSSSVSLFKTTDHILNIVENSPPFRIPDILDLVDYFLVLPNNYQTFNPDVIKSVYSKGILKSTTKALPLFRKCVSKGKPLMVFVFDSNKENHHRSTLAKIMNVRDYFPVSGQLSEVSTFFDSFAQNWVQKVGYDNLISSIFCTTEKTSLDGSYCLKIPENKSVHLFPAFFEAPKLNSNSMFQTQVLKQANGLLRSGARTFDKATYDIAHDPKSSIKSADDKLDELLMKISNKAKDVAESIGAKVDNVKEKLSEGKANLAPPLSDQKSNSEDNSVPDKYNSPHVTKRRLEFEIQSHPDGGFIFPLSLLKENKVFIKSPRSRAYSQIVYDAITQSKENSHFQHKRNSVFSNDEDCEQITWYNIFHHSIFGKPKFCVNQTTNL